MTHKQEALFAIEDEPSHPDLSRGLADYRRLNANQRAAYAAELKRKVKARDRGTEAFVSKATNKSVRLGRRINIRDEKPQQWITHNAPVNDRQLPRLDHDPILRLAISPLSNGVACRGPTKRTMVRRNSTPSILRTSETGK